jgi:hypothetical protein
MSSLLEIEHAKLLKNGIPVVLQIESSLPVFSLANHLQDLLISYKFRISSYGDSDDPKFCFVKSCGRLHYELLSTDEYFAIKPTVNLILRGFENICKEYFSLHSHESVPRDDYYLSTLQYVNALPGSTNQMWHADNASYGLTIIIPLTNFNAHNGATQLINGSYSYDISRNKFMLFQPDLKMGQALLFDSRTLHRGLGNSTLKDRPALIVRYDRKVTPPPGMGVFGTIARRVYGFVINRFFVCPN